MRIERHRLLVIAETLRPFVPKNPLFPILDNVLMVPKDDFIVFAATDNQNSIEYLLPITEIEAPNKSSVCFDILLVADYIKNLKDEFIELFFADNGLSISHSKGSIDIVIQSASEFPYKEVIESERLSDANGSEFLTGIKAASNIIKIDREFPMPSDSIHIKSNEPGYVDIFSSEGAAYRFFSVVKASVTDFEGSISIHQAQVSKLMNFITRKPSIQIGIHNGNIIAKDSNSIVSIVTGTYTAPPYEKIKDQIVKATVIFNKDELSSCIDRLSASIRGIEKNYLVIKSNKNCINFALNNYTYGISASENLDPVEITGELDIVLDLTQVSKSIKFIESDQIQLVVFPTAVKFSSAGNDNAFFVTGLINLMK